MTGPFRLVDNEHSLLDVSDLVFIDPVSTGYSRAVVGEKAKQFHGFQRDIESVGEFIRLWTTRNRRWTSPKFLIGESYGTTRAAGVAALPAGPLRPVPERPDAGLVRARLRPARVRAGNDPPYIGFLPTYAATAWYHSRLAPELQADLRATLAEVEAFAVERLRRRAGQGRAAARRRARADHRAARALHRAAEDYIDRADLRIVDQRFFKELLRDQRRTVGRLDSRFTRHRPRRGRRDAEYDPSFGAVDGAVRRHVQRLRARRPRRSRPTARTRSCTPTLWKTWSYADHENQYVDVGETLRKTMTATPA